MTRRRLSWSTRATAPAVALAVALVGGAGVVAGFTGAPGDASAPVAAAPVASPAAESAAAPAAQQRATRARAVPPKPPAVAPLRGITRPDALVVLDRSLTPAEIAALRELRGVEGVLVAGAGTASFAGVKVPVLGVDPGALRGYTPEPSAKSDQLWQVMARGELVVSFPVFKGRKLALGATLPVAAARTVPMRVGAAASLGLRDEVGAVVSAQRGKELGLRPAAAVLVHAPERDPQRLRSGIRKVLGKGTEVTLLRATAAPSTVARVDGKPRNYKELYMAAATTCRGLHWSLLAAIGHVETGHGRNKNVSSAGAMGPMQFMPATWAAYGLDGDGDGVADILNPFDAVYSAAFYLCDHGAGFGGQSLYDAVFAYNHADWYVKKVLALADAYAQRYG